MNVRNNDTSDVKNHESGKSDIYSDDLESLLEMASEVPSVCDKQAYEKTEYSVMSNIHAET